MAGWREDSPIFTSCARPTAFAILARCVVHWRAPAFPFAKHVPADPMTYFQDLNPIRYHDGPHCADDWQCPLFAVGFVLHDTRQQKTVDD